MSTPGDGAHYAASSTISAAYSCQDEPGGSGTSSCTGTVPRGHAIDTTSPGTKAFTVTATDNAHNQASKTVHYAVDADPVPAQVKASVEAALQAATKALTRLRLHTLARAKSFRFSFTAPMDGTAVFKATARLNGKTITVAGARLVFSAPGKTTVTQKLSRSAAVALQRLSAVSVVERIQFAPAHGSPFTARKRLTLKR